MALEEINEVKKREKTKMHLEKEHGSRKAKIFKQIK